MGIIAMVYLGYAVIINIVTLVAYAMDKAAAKAKARRTPEKTLLLLTIAGGWLGAMVGIYVIRHKSQHLRFILTAWAATIIHAVLFGYLLSLGG